MLRDDAYLRSKTVSARYLRQRESRERSDRGGTAENGSVSVRVKMRLGLYGPVAYTVLHTVNRQSGYFSSSISEREHSYTGACSTPRCPRLFDS